MPSRKPKAPRKNAAGQAARVDRQPSARFHLTAEERKLLKDPDWIDEDEADTILALRDERNLRDSDFVNLRDYIRSRGRDVKD